MQKLIVINAVLLFCAVLFSNTAFAQTRTETEHEQILRIS